MNLLPQLKADQARKIAETALNQEYCDLIDRVYSEVNKYASDGKFCVVVSTSNREECIKKILDKLRADGYDAQHNNYYDQRECEQINSITISW